MSPRQAPTSVECITPILWVADLSTSLRYYVTALGFVVD